jgi:hypothetical protein
MALRELLSAKKRTGHSAMRQVKLSGLEMGAERQISISSAGPQLESTEQF